MAKYSKRQARRASQIQLAQAASSATTAQPSGFNPDYSYVVKDLRRIGILAASFVAILVVLSFFLQ